MCPRVHVIVLHVYNKSLHEQNKKELGMLLRVKGHHSPMAAAVRRSMAVLVA